MNIWAAKLTLCPQAENQQMTEKDIPGQSELKNVFRQMVNEQRVPHAMLLHGNEGGSSLALALYLVQCLMCENPQGGDPCEECPRMHKNTIICASRCALHLSCEWKQNGEEARTPPFG